MKILFLNYEYPPLGGGAGNATQYLLREYAKVPDLEVHLITSSVDAEFHDECIGGKVFVHSVPIGKNAKNLHFQSMKDLLVYTWAGYKKSNELLRAGKFDLVHAFFSVPCGYMALRLSKKYRVPYIVSLRGADVPGFSERFSFLYHMLKPAIRRIWKDAAVVIAASAGLKRLAGETNSKQQMSIIPNGIDIAEFTPSTGSADGIFRVISTSRLTPRKGLRYLVQALALLKKEKNISNVEAILVGDGHERESLESLAQEQGVSAQVKFIGRVAHNELSRWYARADAFILPSMNEGMSNAMLEAAASGLPLLVTHTGGSDEVLLEGKNGFEIKMKSARDIADKVARLVNDPALRRSMAQASRRKAESMSWGNVAERYIEQYRKAKDLFK